MYGNYQRSGTVKNIEMEEYRNRIKSEEHDVILVKNHKTKDRYGSAKVVCKKETVEVIEKYLEYAPESKYLFVTRTGHQVANPFRELENLCIQMGHQPIKISPTEHRKQSASRVELGRDEKMTLKISQMMDHSIDTHRAKYTFVNTAKEAIGAYKTLQDWRHSQHTKKEQKIEECEDREREVKRKRKWNLLHDLSCSKCFYMSQNLYQQLLKELKSQHASLTTDSWTSKMTESYTTLTILWINKNWELINKVLFTKEPSERHTGIDIANCLRDGCVEWGISEEHITAIVHDNASNMMAASRELG
ncbi:PREDICTED: uncharacterized protein LOC109590949 [Amphimedon queenslandica]|uniref:DUF659 domain-containing protein n=1 Tax=Amphimedon queenslandica TaxID=400682 RepID=A0A1X7SY25_AMPQE|nr:PREDICTED: uncharacterized protein LOC109590949 [Amphimedon queenslandica]|eukprot:XP_019862344.1 PREDICTED: uncharacterized protein LOC109590949 [Amphimedon queenslandica]